MGRKYIKIGIVIGLCFITMADTKKVKFSGRWMIDGSCGRMKETFLNAHCCTKWVRLFKSKFIENEMFLTSYLQTLKEWKCRKELKSECQNPRYNFTTFTSMAYIYFCNHALFRDQCKSNHTAATTLADLYNSVDETTTACIQMKMFHRNGIGDYVEVIQPMPGCRIVWQGFDRKFYESNQLSLWKIVGSKCTSTTRAMFAVQMIMILVIVIGNGTVIAVFMSDSTLHKVQWIYKFTLAIADVLVGLVVLPLMLGLQDEFLNRKGSVEHKLPYGYRDPNATNPNYFRYTSLDFEIEDTWIVKAVGFLSYVSLFVSVYTLIAASVDRFFAIYMPMKYNLYDSIIYSKYACIAICLTSILFAALPLFVDSLAYHTIANFFVTSSDMKFVTLVIAIPILLVWVFSVATFLASYQRRTNSSERNSQRRLTDIRLARTLFLIAGAFTMSALPSFVISILFLLNQTTWNKHKQEIDLSIYEAVVWLCLLSNSIWNCLIYSVRSKDFRKATREFYQSKIEALLNRFRRIKRGIIVVEKRLSQFPLTHHPGSFEHGPQA